MPSATKVRFRFCEFRFGPDRPLHLRAGEHDIGADDDPKGVLADDRDGDKDANDPNNCHHERGDKSKTHLHPGLLTHCPRAARIRRSLHITVAAAYGPCGSIASSCAAVTSPRPARTRWRLDRCEFLPFGKTIRSSSGRVLFGDQACPIFRIARVSGSGARSAAIPSSAKKSPPADLAGRGSGPREYLATTRNRCGQATVSLVCDKQFALRKPAIKKLS